jgi:hypothetical protein
MGGEPPCGFAAEKTTKREEPEDNHRKKGRVEDNGKIFVTESFFK